MDFHVSIGFLALANLQAGRSSYERRSEPKPKWANQSLDLKASWWLNCLSISKLTCSKWNPHNKYGQIELILNTSFKVAAVRSVNSDNKMYKKLDRKTFSIGSDFETWYHPLLSLAPHIFNCNRANTIAKKGLCEKGGIGTNYTQPQLTLLIATSCYLSTTHLVVQCYSVG